MQACERTNLREELDEALLPFRLVRKRKGKPRDGWVRGIREAIGLPVEELERRVGVQRWEIHRIEKSEQSQRVMLSTLKRAAEGLGCEVVYALVPKEGTLKEMAQGAGGVARGGAGKEARGAGRGEGGGGEVYRLGGDVFQDVADDPAAGGVPGAAAKDGPRG